MRSADRPSLVAGLVLVCLGALLLAEATGAVDLRFTAFAPIACAAIGAILLALGLGRDP